MATVTHAGTTWNTTAGNKTVVATPAASDLIVVIAATSGLSGGTTNVTDNNSDGLGAYTQVDSDRTGFSTTGVLTVWVRNALVGSASSTTFTAAQGSSTGGGLTVLRVSSMTRTGSLAVKSNGGQSSGTSGTTPAPVLSSTPSTSNPIITAISNGATAASMTQPSSYTEHFDNGYSTPGTGLDVASIDSGITNATITWGSTSATTFASVAIELDTSAIPGPTITAFETSSWTTTTTPKTITVTGAVTGDLILVGMGGDNGSAGSPVSAASVSTTGGSTGSWSEPEEHLNAGNQGWTSTSAATVTADGTVTVSLARTQSTGAEWGGFAALLHNHGGVGNHTFLGNGATESVSLTTSQDSAALMIGIDWDQLATVAFVPSGAVDIERTQNPNVTVYAGYWRAQASGSRNYGIGTSSTANFTMSVVEILAATSGVTGIATADFGFTATAAGIDRALGVATGSFGFTAAAAGIDRAVGAAIASFGFTATTQGIDRAVGAAVASLGFTAAASGQSGSPPVTGAASGLFGFTATALGIPRARGVAVASFGFTASVAGVDRSVGAALATFGFTGSGSGIDRAVGIAASIFGFTAVVIGIPGVHGAAVGSFGFTGTAQGFAGSPPVTGAAAGSFGFTATTQGRPRSLGLASGGFGFTATTVGRPRVHGAAVASFVFAASAAGNRRALGLAQAVFTFIAAANGQGATVSAQSLAVVIEARTGASMTAAKRSSTIDVSGRTSVATVS